MIDFFLFFLLFIFFCFSVLSIFIYLFIYFPAPLGSVIINKFGYRICSMVDGFIAATGLSLGFFATDILFLFFSHGILTGKYRKHSACTKITMLLSSDIEFIRLDQKQRRNGEACPASPT